MNNYIKNIGVSTVGRILGRSIGYISQIILARLLAPDGFGLFAIGWTVLRLFSIAGHLGLDYGVISFGSRYWQKDNEKLVSVVITSIITAFLSGLIFGALLFLTAPWLANFIIKKPELIPILRGFSITFPLATTLRVLAAATSISGRMSCAAIAEDLTQPVAQIILFLFFIQTQPGISSAIWSTTASYAIAVIIGAICVKMFIPSILDLHKIYLQTFLPLIRFSIPAIVGATLGAFNLWGDRLLVGYFGTKADTGIYQSISVITMITTITLSGIKTSIAPAVSKLHQNNNLKELKSLAKSSSRIALYASLPILLLVFFRAEKIIELTFGNSYISGTYPLIILTLGQIIYLITGASDQIFLMTGAQKLWLQISLLVFVVTVALDSVFIPKAHLMGASLVSTTAMALLAFLSIVTIHLRYRFWMIDFFHFKIILSASAALAITYFLDTRTMHWLDDSLAFTFIFISLLFYFLLWITGIDESDKLFLKNLIKYPANR